MAKTKAEQHYEGIKVMLQGVALGSTFIAFGNILTAHEFTPMRFSMFIFVAVTALLGIGLVKELFYYYGWMKDPKQRKLDRAKTIRYRSITSLNK